MTHRAPRHVSAAQSDPDNELARHDRSPVALSPEQSEFARVIGRLLAEEWEARGAGGQPDASGQNFPSAAGQ